MGGKTQQRVAGNARPANSGRIRELLVNQRLTAGPPGQIITFSALSNKKQPCAKKEDKKVDNSEERSEETTKPEEPIAPVQNSEVITTPTKENFKLVVKRVGNRELYTRVRLSEQVDSDDGSTKPAVSPSEAGVKKPSFSLDENTTQLQGKSACDELSGIEEGDDVKEKSDTETDDELEGDFDELVDRLGHMKEETVSADILGETSEKQIEKELGMLKMLRTLVKKFSRDLSIEEWDLIQCSLYKWTSWISKAEHPLKETFHADFTVKVIRFIHQLLSFAEILNAQESNLNEFPMMQALLDDWSNFQSSNMFQELLVLFFKLVSLMNCDESSSTVQPIIESIAHIIIGVDPRLILSHYSILDNLSSEVEFDPEFKEPQNSVFCNVDEKKFKSFFAVCGLLRSNCRVILVTSHTMLSKTLNSICGNAIHAIIPAQAQEEIIDEEIPIFPPAALMSILTSRDAIMSTLLSDYNVGDTSVTIEHDTDAYSCTLSYLFVWDLVIQFIVGVDKQIGHRIIHTLKKLGLIHRLLDNIFMLLPPLGQQNTLRFAIYKSATSSCKSLVVAGQSNEQQQRWNLENFLKSPLKTTIKRPLNEIELIALHLYFSVALHMPVTVRKWYNNNSNKRLCNLVNEYTVRHVSRVICSLEMESVQEKCLERAAQVGNTNLTIKARPSAKEVYAVYHRDEFQLELTIKLPLNYPLGPVQIDGGKRVGVTDVKWRSWLLQLTKFLAHQNGPILDGIDLWRKNIDKRFEGVEKCTICFSILHSNYQLPKKKCQTCSNVFHNLCLYKWFESSGNSTCPLCRNPW